MRDEAGPAGVQEAPAGAALFDHRTIDWSRAVRAVYQVRQHYRYTYTGPVHDLRQRLVMIPIDTHGDQHLLSFDLDVRGATNPTETWETDSFGNRVGRITIDRVERAVDFEVRYRVERDGRPPVPSPAWHQVDRFLAPTALTAPDSRLVAAAHQIAGVETSALARADRAFEWASAALTYGFGTTGVQTPAAHAYQLGQGVCQDFSHLLLCVLRLLKIPARYVSGHLLGEGAPHAWVEARVPDPAAETGYRVVAYDPTNRRRAGLNYVTVAVGRDYADVSPTSGVFSGPAVGRLSWSKQADILAVEYRETSAGGEVA